LVSSGCNSNNISAIKTLAASIPLHLNLFSLSYFAKCENNVTVVSVLGKRIKDTFSKEDRMLIRLRVSICWKVRYTVIRLKKKFPSYAEISTQEDVERKEQNSKTNRRHYFPF